MTRCHSTRRPPAQGQDGFTLLELLVSLALLALLVAGLAPSLRIGSQAWDLVAHNASEDAEMQTAQEFIRHSIASTYPAAFIDEDGHRHLAFAGAADSLAMVTPMPAYLGLGGLQVIRIGLTAREGRRDLTAIWAPLRAETQTLDPGDEAQSATLTQGISELEIRYYGRESASEPPSWFETWEGHAGLPLLVRLRMKFPPDSARSWADMMVRPMIDLAAMVRR